MLEKNAKVAKILGVLLQGPPPFPASTPASAAREAKTFVVIKVPNHAGHFHPIHHLHSSFQQAHIPANKPKIRGKANPWSWESHLGRSWCFS